jgi:iron complex outermembrane receptor protein
MKRSLSLRFPRTSLFLAISILAPLATAQTPADNSVEEVVVTGMRASLEKAIAVKQQSDKVMLALAMDDINATPAVTIAEALVRLPGINEFA